MQQTRELLRRVADLLRHNALSTIDERTLESLHHDLLYGVGITDYEVDQLLTLEAKYS